MRNRLCFFLVAVAAMLGLTVAQAGAAPTPAWRIHSTAVPANFIPGTAGQAYYQVVIENSGGASTNGTPLTLTDTLPLGVTASALNLTLRTTEGSKGSGGSQTSLNEAENLCETTTSAEVQTITCKIPSELPGFKTASLQPSEQLQLLVRVAIPANAGGTLINFASIRGGGAPAAQTVSQNAVSPAPAGSGFEAFQAALTDEEGQGVEQAGSHPYQYSTYFAINTKPTPPGTAAPFVPAGGDVRDIEVQLPPGLVGNPMATTRCTNQQFVAQKTRSTAEILQMTGAPGFPAPYNVNECADGAAIGMVVVQQLEGNSQLLATPLYNLVPPPGMPAQLGFLVSGAPFYIDTSVRTGSDYGISAHLSGVSEIRRISAAAVTIWGTPALDAHDSLRGSCLYQFPEYLPFNGIGSCVAGVAPKPFLRLPTSCTTPFTQTMSFDTWNVPGSFVSAQSPAGPASDCGQLSFSPTISARPQVTTADSPSGLSFNLHVPQPETPDGLATADLKDITVALPTGVSVNPASAGGLVGCTPAQIEIDGPNAAACPSASKIGSVEVHTPLLDHPIKGAVYVASQGDNPFGSLIAIYVTADDPATGVVLKLAGKVELNEGTGQITARFTENPQLPFEDLNVEFFDGPRGSLRTPPSCGNYTIATTMTPWSSPESGPPATPSDSFSVANGPGGGGCPNGATAVTLSAGLQTPIGGSYSPFVLRLTRADGTGEISSVDATPPKGLLARLAGIPYCSEAGISQARGRDRLGGGQAELNSPSCSAASRVGSITVGAGAGSMPFYTGGQVYLAGAYKGAPLSLVAIVPAVAGPFDLGVVTDRIALDVNPETAQVSAKGDPFPTMLAGIPLDVKDIRLALDRPEFTVAPTNCTPSSVRATAFGPGGATDASDRFQVGSCAGLDFAPKLKLSLKGSTKHAGHPGLKAVLTYPKHGTYANIARAQVNLPHSEFIDQGNLNKTCTKPVLLAGNCPKRSIYGKAKAWTPLLDKPLQGPVYLVGGYGYKLPALVAELNGQIRVLLVGKVDSGPNKGIRNTFEAVPDAPVSRFVLEMKGGRKYSLLENSENLCSKRHRAIARFTAQSGKILSSHPVVQVRCGKSAKKKHSKKPAK